MCRTRQNTPLLDSKTQPPRNRPNPAHAAGQGGGLAGLEDFQGESTKGERLSGREGGGRRGGRVGEPLARHPSFSQSAIEPSIGLTAQRGPDRIIDLRCPSHRGEPRGEAVHDHFHVGVFHPFGKAADDRWFAGADANLNGAGNGSGVSHATS